YVIGGGGKIRVVDVTAQKDVVKTRTVPPNTLIQIDAATGITIGGKQALKGPLPNGHEYAIYQDRK
ncbi:MAG: hypothetical protein ACREIT_08455, partial [Tepidisphaeraceae bacterium]